jgi:AcrR family transcriptional regulator
MLYRRFADRGALIQAVAVDCIERLTELAQHARDQAPDAWSALRRVVLDGGDLMQVFAVVRPHLLDTVHENRELLDAGQQWLDLLAQMVEAAQVQGDVRRDIGPGDIALMLNLLTRPLLGLSADVAAVVPERFLELMLDALRPHPATTLPGRAITRWW